MTRRTAKNEDYSRSGRTPDAVRFSQWSPSCCTQGMFCWLPSNGHLGPRERSRRAVVASIASRRSLQLVRCRTVIGWGRTFVLPAWRRAKRIIRALRPHPLHNGATLSPETSAMLDDELQRNAILKMDEQLRLFCRAVQGDI